MGCTSSRCASIRAKTFACARVGVTRDETNKDHAPEPESFAKTTAGKPFVLEVLDRDYTPTTRPRLLSYIQEEEAETEDEEDPTHTSSLHGNSQWNEPRSGWTPPPHEEAKEEEEEHEQCGTRLLPPLHNANTQENLWICFVAAVELMRIQGGVHSLLDEIVPEDIVRTAKQTAPNDQMTPHFDALGELSILLQSCTDFMGFLNMGYICHDGEDLMQCFMETVREAMANEHSTLALFTVGPENHVFLSIFFDGDWYAWTTEPATLQRTQPTEIIDHWMTNVSIEKGLTIKAVTFLHNHGNNSGLNDMDALTDSSESVQTYQSGDVSSLSVPSRAKSSSGDSSSIDPLTFLCPISSEIMADPVMADDGYSYERKSIEEHFAIHHYSPITRQPISTKVQENWALREIIHEYVEDEANGIDADELEDFRHRRRLSFDRDDVCIYESD